MSTSKVSIAPEQCLQEMCELFWPTEVGVPMAIGPMKISLMNTIQSEHYDVYELTITVEVMLCILYLSPCEYISLPP